MAESLVAYRPLRQIACRATDFFHAKAPPLNLAVFRIFVCAALLFHTPRSSDFLTLPETLLQVPFGSKIFYILTPKTQLWSDVLSSVFALSCLCGIVGLYTRFAVAIAGATGLFVYGLPQFFGKVDHSHHLVWFAVLLACSPCGDAVSVDGWRAKLSGRAKYMELMPARKYALPLRLAWVIMGLIYFFPGVWKLLAVGWDWALSDNIKYTIYHKWFDLGVYRPPFSVDAYPLVYRSLGLAALLFELGFIVAIFLVPLRRLCVVAGLAFHTWIYFFLDIKLYGLPWCYVALIDWAALRHRLSGSNESPRFARNPGPESGQDTGDTLPIRVAGATLIAGVILSGATHLNSWPFAVYPTFAAHYGPTIATLRVDAISPGGRATIDTTTLYSLFVTPMRWRVVQYRALLAEDHETRRRYCEALRALFTTRLNELQAADRVELRQVVQWVDPARRHDPPLADELYCSWQTAASKEPLAQISDKTVDVRDAIPVLHRIYMRDAPLAERMGAALRIILGIDDSTSSRNDSPRHLPARTKVE